jgi:cytochrome P450/NADPH-cytochrome P450 reductase
MNQASAGSIDSLPMEIPQPPPRRVLGNLPDLESDEVIIVRMMELAQEYGPIYKLQFPQNELIVISGLEYVDQVCDDRHFDKMISGGLMNVRAFAGDGLFTAWTQEPNWSKAHNILLPSFSQQAIRSYMPQMVDLAQQLCDHWSRLNPDDEIDVSADMTRLTLDTIGLCGFNYRFNSFYREGQHPFVAAMVGALEEAQNRNRRLPLQNRLMVRAQRQFQDDITTMNLLADRLIRERRDSELGTEINDLLEHMLVGVDKKTGESLDDINIRYQLITFLIAGHETTSGLLSFAIYFLLKHPDVLARAYEEVDAVLGDDLDAPPTIEQLARLPYLNQILKESLRLWPTAPGFTRYAYEETLLGGRYLVRARQPILTLLPALHRDPAIWGDNATEFDPEHFAPERERALPAHAYKPFGTGQRACIGRQFALQEAQLALAMILQRFTLIDHRDYQLTLKQTLTIKPEGLMIQVRPRTERRTMVVTAAPAPEPQPEEAPHLVSGDAVPLLVLFGSNLGTAEGLAQQIANDGVARGFAATIAPLDDYVDRLPTDGAVVIVSASYNGTPPDNASAFCQWLQGDLSPTALSGVHYTVFGCGNRDWAATYQAVPTLIDTELAAHGAERIHARGEGDARDDFDGQFRAWYGSLWSDIAKALNLALADTDAHAMRGHTFEVEILDDAPVTPLAAAYHAVTFEVLENRELQRRDGPNPSSRSTRHIALAIPEGLSYRTGDYLGVVPRNHPDLVKRVLTRFNLSDETTLLIRGNVPARTQLPLDQPVTAGALLRDYVELQDAATRAQIQVLAGYTACPPEQEQLLSLGSDDPEHVAHYREAILAKRVSVIDLLETFPSCALPFNIFLELQAPLRPRYYSISSSPLMDPTRCTITVGVVEGPARSGHGVYHGVCSTYLAGREAGSHVSAFLQAPSTPFRLPEDPGAPLIMVGPGTGIAPFRGFLEERAALAARGDTLGEAVLFFGCRNPEQDFIYEDELRKWADEGIVTLHAAFSRVANQPKAYVQDQILAQADEVWRLLEAGAFIYVCGDASRMAPDVQRAFASVYRQHTGSSEAAANEWIAKLIADGRYIADVWAS